MPYSPKFKGFIKVPLVIPYSLAITIAETLGLCLENKSLSKRLLKIFLLYLAAPLVLLYHLSQGKEKAVSLVSDLDQEVDLFL